MTFRFFGIRQMKSNNKLGSNQTKVLGRKRIEFYRNPFVEKKSSEIRSHTFARICCFNFLIVEYIPTKKSNFG